MASELAKAVAVDIEALIDAKISEHEDSIVNARYVRTSRNSLAETIDDLLKNLIFAPIDHYKVN